MKRKNGELIIETEKELFLYWLIQAYHALGREGYEEGMTLTELRNNLLDVLANAECDPNLSKQGQQLKNAKKIYYISENK